MTISRKRRWADFGGYFASASHTARLHGRRRRRSSAGRLVLGENATFLPLSAKAASARARDGAKRVVDYTPVTYSPRSWRSRSADLHAGDASLRARPPPRCHEDSHFICAGFEPCCRRKKAPASMPVYAHASVFFRRAAHAWACPQYHGHDKALSPPRPLPSLPLRSISPRVSGRHARARQCRAQSHH